jgi:hypothetical protein
MRARIERAEKAAYQLGMQADAAGAAVAASEAWLNRHRTDGQLDTAGRAELAAELRMQRAIVTGYNEALQAIRQEIAAVRDAAGGTAQAAGDAGLRREYLELVEQEREVLRRSGAAAPPAEAGELARGEALAARLDRTDAAAERLKGQFAETARRSAARIGGWIAEERAGLLAQGDKLATLDGEARDIIGRIAFRSFSAVRAQFYKLVLKADVGIVDVAWSRKRERVEKIQQLSQQKASELEAMDRDYRLLLREIE